MSYKRLFLGFVLVAVLILVVTIYSNCCSKDSPAVTSNITPTVVVWSDNSSEARYASSIRSYNEAQAEYYRQSAISAEKQNEYVQAATDYKNALAGLEPELADARRLYAETLAQLQTAQALLDSYGKVDENLAKYRQLVAVLQSIQSKQYDVVNTANFTDADRVSFYKIYDAIWWTLW